MRLIRNENEAGWVLLETVVLGMIVVAIVAGPGPEALPGGTRVLAERHCPRRRAARAGTAFYYGSGTGSGNSAERDRGCDRFEQCIISHGHVGDAAGEFLRCAYPRLVADSRARGAGGFSAEDETS